jgi:transposase InsO family protein
MRAVLEAAHLLGLATGVHLRQLRSQDDPLRDLQARLELAELQARLAWQVVDLLVARFARIPEQRRPHFTPAQRFLALEIKNLLSWSADRAATILLVCPNTIRHWEQQADPTARAVGSAVKPTPPVRRAADVVRHLAQRMAAAGFGGSDMIARVLARAGWKVSARSVSRYNREGLPPQPPGPRAPDKTTSGPVITRFVHHTWMMDVTEIRALLGRPFQVVAVFDAHSRVPLALRVLDHKPSAREAASLLRRAIRAFKAPRYVITDLGPEFAGAAFQLLARRSGIETRFASKDNIRATARLERFWRTLKDIAGVRGVFAPLTCDDLERRLELPSPSHWGEHERRIRPRNAHLLLPHVTAGQALQGLRTKPEPGEEVAGRYGHLLPGIPPGENYLHYTTERGHPEPLFQWRTRYWTFLLKLSPDRPAPTIQGQPGPYVGPFHWDNRRLRTPELKRLQGFPDEFELEGNRRNVQLQVGNSVPPPLGAVVATAVRQQLEDKPRFVGQMSLLDASA